ncbi:hypothetical protein CU098_013216 [Rhizopus stolonifer]|uniref:DUF1206 domain-containing protein n=1 Tax=Rhizopus stolonifer TaxID=4846 RepID=A0A367KUL5_RHIST|nr:hypothetical protein CU098_013216 [Rhizopus stolonifer]
MFAQLIPKKKKNEDDQHALNNPSSHNIKKKLPKTIHGEPSTGHYVPTSGHTDQSAVSAPPIISNERTSSSQLHFYQGGVRKEHKHFVKWIGRIGFIAKGIVYGCIGVLTISNVTGAWTPNGSAGNESPQGAFLLLGGIPTIGRSILIVMAVGLVLYIIWRMWEAITGQGSDASFSKKKNFFRYRLSPFVSGLVYTAYAYYVIRMIFQTSEEQQASASSKTFPASWTDSTLGKAGIGILAIAFMIAFTTQVINAISGNFIQDLKTSKPGARKWEAFIVHMFGRVGFGGRAALFGTMAGFFWDSLAEANESGSKNMVAAAISKLANTGGGRFFMVVLGLGLVIYAVFAVSNAYYKYFPTPPPTRHEYYTHDVVHPDESSDSSDSSSRNSSTNDPQRRAHSHNDTTKSTTKEHKHDDDTPSTASGIKHIYKTSSWFPSFWNRNKEPTSIDLEKQQSL